MKAPNVDIGHARGVHPAAVGYACGCGRHTPESEPDGIRHLVDGKPYYTGREN